LDPVRRTRIRGDRSGLCIGFNPAREISAVTPALPPTSIDDVHSVDIDDNDGDDDNLVNDGGV
jgi:hypothetical protein